MPTLGVPGPRYLTFAYTNNNTLNPATTSSAAAPRKTCRRPSSRSSSPGRATKDLMIVAIYSRFNRVFSSATRAIWLASRRRRGGQQCGGANYRAVSQVFCANETRVHAILLRPLNNYDIDSACVIIRPLI